MKHTRMWAWTTGRRWIAHAALVAAFALVTGSVAGASAPAVGPCAASGAYDPACDVDHDGDVDIMDIQKTAGHWNQTGAWMSDNGHNHLGQTWTGNGNSLTIGGTYSYPSAPLVLNNSTGNGLRIGSVSGNGVFVNTAGNPSTVPAPSPGKTGFEVAGAERVGLQVGYSGIDGVYVDQADRNGVTVNRAGNPSAISFSGQDSGFEVRGSESYGLYVGRADNSGVYVNSAGNDGVNVFSTGNPSTSICSPSKAGFEVCGAEFYGLFVGRADGYGVVVSSAGFDGVAVGTTGFHGVTVSSAGFDGVVVDSAGFDGVVVDSAGIDGVQVNSAGLNGVYANTTNANHEWGLITPDKISGSNVTLSSLTVIAEVTGEQALNTGDVVAAVGLSDPLPDSAVPIALVRLADATTAVGVVGVVEGRMALTAQPQREDEHEKEPIMELRSADGPAQPGDYVALTVLGVTQVKVQEGAAIQPGQRLTASDVAGRVRALRTETLNGMIVSEGAPVVGTALAAPESGIDTIPVFVTLR